MKQPISTFTNAAYIAAPIAAGISSFIEWYAALMLVLLGLASGLFHATQKYRWQKADEIGMYAAFFGLLALQLVRLAESPAGMTIALAAHCTVAVTYMGLKHRRFDSFSSLGLLFAATWLAYLLHAGPLQAGIVLAVFGGSLAVRQWGIKEDRWHNKPHYQSRPGDALHGLWHIGTAFGFYLMMS